MLSIAQASAAVRALVLRTVTAGCVSNDTIDLLLQLEQRVHAAEEALAAHVRLVAHHVADLAAEEALDVHTRSQVAELTAEVAVQRAQLDELYVGAGVDHAISEVRNWEGSQ